MLVPPRPKAKLLVGPDGSPLTIADLPAPGTTRWVIRRKAEVVAAVRGGVMSLEDVTNIQWRLYKVTGTDHEEGEEP